jgi:hypothetical protein
MSETRPHFSGAPGKINYKEKFTVTVSNPGKASKFKGNLWITIYRQSRADLGISLHPSSWI